MLDDNDNIHHILQDSALHEKAFSIFDFAEDDDPTIKNVVIEDDTTLKDVMIDACDETEAAEAGEIENIDDNAQGKTCQTFFMPSALKKQFESICKNNCTTPSAFLRNVCARLVESYYGTKETT